MAFLDMSLDNMVVRRSNRVRGGGRGRGLRGVRGSIGPLALRGVSAARHLYGHRCRGPLGLRAKKGPRGTFRGARRSDGHRCHGPLGLRGGRGPGGSFRGAKGLDGHHFRGSVGLRGVRGPEGTFKVSSGLDGHPCRSPLGLRGVRGPGGTLGGAGRSDGHHFRGSLGLRGVRGPEGTFKGARRLDGHPCQGPLGLRSVRGPGGTLRGAGRLDGPHRRGPLGMYTIIKTVHGTRDLPGQNSVLEDRFKVVGSSGEASGTKLLVSNGKPMNIDRVGSIERPHVASRLNMIGGAHGRRTARVILSSQRGHDGLSDGVPIHGRGRGRGRRGRHGGLGRRPVEKSAEELNEELENHQAETSQT